MDFSFDPRTERGDGETALFVAVLLAAVYWLTAFLGGSLGRDEAVYFDRLAEAFLHGRLDIEAPPITHDLAFVNGRWHVPFPPGPALLLLPGVAVFGAGSRFETHLLPLLGGVNVALVYLLVQAMRQRLWIGLHPAGSLWLAALFGLGTAHWPLAATPRVWFVAQVVTVTFLVLAAWLAARQASPAYIGLALAGAVLTRPHVALALPFFIAEAASRERWAGYQPALQVLWLALPVAAAAAGLLWYNQARFGDPLEFGYTLANVDAALADDLRRYGQFNLAYLPRNLQAAVGGLPLFHERFPYFTPRAQGLSLFLATPALLYLFRREPRGLWSWGAWLAVLLIQGPLLLYYNTGWQQFGYRFGLDYMVFALALVAANAGRRVSPVLAALIGLSILVTLRGVAWWIGVG
jgi:hypothetical protein